MSSLPRASWWGFALYGVAALVHVTALAIGADAVAAPTKLTLMPLLAVAVLWAGRGSQWGRPYTLLFCAIALSWLGDGAGTFFPFAPELPMMLLCFGLAHLCYIWLFWRILAVRRLPGWAAVYGVWWVGLLLVLWPSLGALLVPVAIYGLVLGGTAAAASRCHPLIAWGGAFFLASDTILAFRLFTPDAMPDWTSPLVMITYCLGQGLIAAGVVLAERARTTSPAAEPEAEPEAASA
ncbi:lysoplasmalogenase [Microbacterium sp. SS28]|uniref:lysoplasmalogenase n=1 Tax=Microbacterium sp. SS28 TaxID=2919948 RepID=UPI001FAA6FE7|nr:lysoplasmalogenase [Microbacterium sp. SS28]